MRTAAKSWAGPSAYGELLSAHQARQSVGRPGTCWDNAVAESFFATVKNGLIYRHAWPTRRHAELAIFEFVAGRYNQPCHHFTLGYCSPAEAEGRTSPATLAPDEPLHRIGASPVPTLSRF